MPLIYIIIRPLTCPIIVSNVIAFTKSSNSTLDGILHDLQHKVILPSHLSLAQRKKLGRGRWKTKLEQSPIEIEIDDQKIQFRHLSGPGGDIPSSRGMLYRAIENMQTKDDWQKLPKLLEALYFNANRKFQYSDWPKIVRKAGTSGNLGPIFDGAKRPERTGLKLDKSETVQEFMLAVVLQVAKAEWVETAAARGLQNAEKVLVMLNDKKHLPRGQAKVEMELSSRFPLARDPQILATPLCLAAVLVSHNKNIPEYQEKLRTYTRQLLESWPEGQGLLELHPHEAYVDNEGMRYLMDKNKFLAVAAPILKGFNLAIEGLDSDMASSLKSRRDALADEVAAALAEVGEGRRGRIIYEKCFGETKAEAEA